MAEVIQSCRCFKRSRYRNLGQEEDDTAEVEDKSQNVNVMLGNVEDSGVCATDICVFFVTGSISFFVLFCIDRSNKDETFRDEKVAPSEESFVGLFQVLMKISLACRRLSDSVCWLPVFQFPVVQRYDWRHGALLGPWYPEFLRFLLPTPSSQNLISSFEQFGS